jgi:hypothetical protein
MRQDKKTAIQLRKQGKSYQEIVVEIGVPKSTLSNWFSGVFWSEKTKHFLSELARENARKRMTVISHKKRDELRENYRKQRIIARKQFKKFIKERLFIAGLMIYWGEGDNKLENGVIRVANSDPLMIRLFYKFLKTYLPEVEHKAKIYLVLYKDLNDEICRHYWSETVGLPLSGFIKSSFIKGRHPTKRLSYGIGTIIISNRLYKEQMMTWVNLAKQKDITRV